MCRLLGVVAPTTDSIAAHLGENLACFTSLSARHRDGWGLAWWDEQGVQQRRRRPERAADSPEYADAVSSARSDSAIVHLRRASQGLPVRTVNSHPFLGEGIAFAHNGFAEPASAIDDLVVRHRGRPSEGDTDSERYFHLVEALMERTTPERALLRAARLIALSTRAEALNALLLTPEALYALRADDPLVTAENGNLPAEYALHYAAGPAGVTVASTGWERRPEDWTELPRWHVLEIRRSVDGSDVTYQVHAPD